MSTTTNSSSTSTRQCSSSSSKRSYDTSTCLLDCQSLQSSLKRVRLSCSPGELRLQRDLRHLVTDDGWSQPREHTWVLESIATLEQVDPLKLLVTCGQYKLWMQFPRMYPHRPPVIARVEGPMTLRILVQEAPPNVHEEEGEGIMDPHCETTLVYNQWSPVMRLGDLIDFLLQWITQTMMTHESSDHDLQSSGASTREPPSSSNAWKKYWISPHFVEEHKMEDHHSQSTDGLDLFPPNRFVTGHGKYPDPTVPVANAMDVN